MRSLLLQGLCSRILSRLCAWITWAIHLIHHLHKEGDMRQMGKTHLPTPLPCQWTFFFIVFNKHMDSQAKVFDGNMIRMSLCDIDTHIFVCVGGGGNWTFLVYFGQSFEEIIFFKLLFNICRPINSIEWVTLLQESIQVCLFLTMYRTTSATTYIVNKKCPISVKDLLTFWSSLWRQMTTDFWKK